MSNVSDRGSVEIRQVQLVGEQADVFRVVTEDCTDEILLPGGSCAVALRAQPQATGDFTATLAVDSSATTGRATAGLTVTGAVGRLQVDPTALDLGRAGVRTAGEIGEIRVRNVGQAAIVVTDFDVPGDDFVLIEESCEGRSLGPDEACTGSVQFRPTQEGPRTGSATVTGDDGDVLTVALRGEGVAGRLRIDPGEIDFQDVAVGSASPSRELIVTNIGDGQLPAMRATIRGVDAADFVAVGSDCARPLDPGGTCSVRVRFAPGSVGTRRAVVVVDPDGPEDAAAALVRGRGITSAVRLSTTDIDFGPVAVSGDGRTDTVIVQSTRGAVLTVGRAEVSSVRGGMSIVADRCRDRRLQQGDTCSIQLRFTPGEPGPDSGTLVVRSSAPDSPAQVSLRGVGVEMALAVEPAVVRRGRVSTIRGEGFNPGDVITVSWDPGLGSTTATISPDGRLVAYLPVMRRDRIGPRDVVAAGPGFRVTQEVLIVNGTVQVTDLRRGF